MENNKYVKRILEHKDFFWYFTAMLVVWGGMLRPSYNADSISHAMSPDSDAMVRIVGGRYLTALIEWGLSRIGISTTSDIRLIECITLFLIAVILYTLHSVFREWCPEEGLSRIGYEIGICLFSVNVLFAEVLFFTEFCLYFVLSYAFAAFAIYSYSQKKLIIMEVWLFLAAITYQYALIFAIIVLLFYIAMQQGHRLSWTLIKRYFAVVGLCVFPGILDLLSCKILYALRLIDYMEKETGLGDLTVKFNMLFENLNILNYNAALLPGAWIPLIFIVSVIVIGIWDAYKLNKRQISSIALIILVSISAICMMYGLPMMSEVFAAPPRMTFTYFLIQGMVVISIYNVTKSKKTHYLVSIICIGYLLIHVISISFILEDRFVSNAIDKQTIIAIDEAITEYETETGEVISKVAIVRDDYSRTFYNEVAYHFEQINERNVYFAPISSINFYTGRNLVEVEMDDSVYKRYFEGKDWNYLNIDKQVYFDGDTMYWCQY